LSIIADKFSLDWDKLSEMGRRSERLLLKTLDSWTIEVGGCSLEDYLEEKELDIFSNSSSDETATNTG
jgi:hypothetical protein